MKNASHICHPRFQERKYGWLLTEWLKRNVALAQTGVCEKEGTDRLPKNTISVYRASPQGFNGILVCCNETNYHSVIVIDFQRYVLEIYYSHHQGRNYLNCWLLHHNSPFESNFLVSKDIKTSLHFRLRFWDFKNASCRRAFLSSGPQRRRFLGIQPFGDSSVCCRLHCPAVLRLALLEV